MATTPNSSRAATASPLLRISVRLTLMYPSVARPKTRLNQSKNFASAPALAFLGRSSTAARAGLKLSALNAEMITEIAMVTANCWYNRPVMPGMKAVGMNTAESTRAMPMTGPEISCMAFSAASFGAMPSSIWRSTASTTTIASSTTRPIASTMPNIDSVLMEKPNSGKSADQRHGNGEQRYERGAPTLEKKIDDDDHEHQRDAQRQDDFPNTFGDSVRLVQGNNVVHVRRKALL